MILPSQLRAVVITWFFDKREVYTGPMAAKPYLDRAHDFYNRKLNEYVSKMEDIEEAGFLARYDTVEHINTFIYEGKFTHHKLEYEVRQMNHDTFQIIVWDVTREKKQVLYWEIKTVAHSIETQIKMMLEHMYDFDTTTLKLA